ncbi:MULTISPECIES: stage III sporulation protein AF [unclassified Geobacillus]|uniref:stage III sporulation protein AF n=1 Tax=unclassified Geobacillus TaxID=2642459 RepID=UPI000BE3346D|nr:MULTISPECIES: stage III sporulation protein AF [unclassified Geobacillus]PDM41232.1 stage III sporulation protein AF [Parageobacillus yumthangensis]RDV22914.1 stage III sporulation protein AF [Parageobacillus toebii]TXK90545.1 stage III sporulation protein AF [Parageobacillus sp. SY1]PUF89763.1 stage III sporulation protein AF [Geobacillus sp. LYN3]TXK88973.1 stage III sporulation protein AF [Geobacillus sp. AYS3]
MQIVIEWVTNILIFILFATMIDLLLPSSNMQKYVKMVVGLILLLLMLSPILKLLSIDPDQWFASIISEKGSQQEMMKNEIEMKKKEIQASQRAYILEQMAVQMKNKVDEELMKEYGLSVEDVSLQTKEKENLQIPKDIETIEVVLTKQEKLGEIQPVIIDTSKPINEPNNDHQLEKEIRTFLATTWEVDENKIAVQVKGREWGDARGH